MADATYLNPIGLLYGLTARDAIETGFAGPLTGGSIGFSGVEIIVRDCGSRRIERCDFANLNQSTDKLIRDALDRLTATPQPVAGLSLDRPRIMGVVNVTPDSFLRRRSL